MANRYKEFCRLTDGHSSGITTVAFSDEGNFVATGGLDGKVCVWRVKGAKLLYTFAGKAAILSLVWIPHREDALLCGSQDGNVSVVTITAYALVVNGFWAHKYPVECLAISGNQVATGAHRELKVWVWNSQSRRFHLMRDIQEPPSSSHNQHQEVLVTSLHWRPASTTNPSLLIVSYMHHGVHIFDTTTWGRRTIPLQSRIADTSLSTDGAYIAISTLDKGVDIYDINTEVVYRSFEHEIGEPYPTPVLFIHGDSNRGSKAIVCGSTVGKVDVWDIHGLGKLHTLLIPKRGKVLALAAHYFASSDPDSYDFLIATGIMHENTSSYCIIWKTEKLGRVHDDVREETPASERRPHDDGEGSLLSLKLTWTAICAFLLAYLAVVSVSLVPAK